MVAEFPQGHACNVESDACKAQDSKDTGVTRSDLEN